MSAEARQFGGLDTLVAAMMNLLWGVNIVAMKATVSATAPFTAGLVRLAAVGLLCLPWIRPPSGRGAALILFGLVNGALFLLFFNLALAAANNVGALAIAGQLSVPIALLLGVLCLGERLTARRVAGVALAFAGVALLLFDPRIVHELRGLALMTIAAACWATSTLIQRRLAGTPVATLYCWTGLVGAGALLPLAAWLEPAGLEQVTHLDWATIGWFAFSVLGATLLGQGGMAWLLGRHPVSTVMPLTLAAPVVSVAASHLLLGAPITVPMIAGGSIALVGVLLLTLANIQPARASTLVAAEGS